MKTVRTQSWIIYVEVINVQKSEPNPGERGGGLGDSYNAGRRKKDIVCAREMKPHYSAQHLCGPHFHNP